MNSTIVYSGNNSHSEKTLVARMTDGNVSVKMDNGFSIDKTEQLAVEITQIYLVPVSRTGFEDNQIVFYSADVSMVYEILSFIFRKINPEYKPVFAEKWLMKSGDLPILLSFLLDFVGIFFANYKANNNKNNTY